MLRRVKERAIPHADVLAKIEWESREIPPDVAHARLKSFFERNVEDIRINTIDYDSNLRAATIAGLIAAGSLGAGKILGDAGAKYPSAVALKFGLAAILPWAYFLIKAWRASKNVHNQAYAKGYELAQHVKHLPKEVQNKLLRDAKAATRSLDPEAVGFARGVINALLEAETNGTK